MKIWVLAENTPFNKSFNSEHGLSLFIETNGKRILFDMGQTELFYESSKAVGVDLEKVDVAILSHGHYDHGGGLEKFLSVNSKAKVYMSKFAFEPHYNGSEKYIGLDKSLTNNERIIFIDDNVSLDDNFKLYTSKAIPKKYPAVLSGLTVKKGEDFVEDDFRHEIYLTVKENKTILFSGCSHNGILNITDYFKPDVLIGGFHFSKLPLDDKLKSYAINLSEYDCEFYTCHCTGVEQFEFMKKELKNLKYLSCGECIEI